jgi:hypothetical protein
LAFVALWSSDSTRCEDTRLSEFSTQRQLIGSSARCRWAKAWNFGSTSALINVRLFATGMKDKLQALSLVG